MTLHHFDLRGRVRVQLLTYVDMSGWKVSIVLLSETWDMFAVKKMCLYAFLTHESMIMCRFEHNFPLVHPMWRASTKLYELRDVTTCKFSLKRRISALVWLTWTPPCATFDICGHVWKVSIVLPTANGLWGVFTVKQRVYITFRPTKTCICVTINITQCFHLPSHPYTWIPIPPRDFFYLQILFNIPLLTYETMSEYIGSTGSNVKCKKTSL